MEHTADIQKSTPDKPKVLKGVFSVVEGKLSFTCTTENVSFEEVLDGLTKLRDELNRQIDNKHLCPFHPKPDAYVFSDENTTISIERESGLPATKAHNHAFFWVENEVLYETYQTIKGKRFRRKCDAPGKPDCERADEYGNQLVFKL